MVTSSAERSQGAKTLLSEMIRSKGGPSIDDVFGAVALKRLALKQDQQVPEWET